MSKLAAIGLLAGGTVVGGAASVPVYRAVRSASESPRAWDIRMTSEFKDAYSAEDATLTPEEKLSMVFETVRQLEADLRDYKNALNVQSKNFSLLNRDRKKMLNKIESLEKNIARLTSENDDLDKRIAALQGESEKLEQELKEYQGQLDSQRALIANEKESSSALKQKLNGEIQKEGALAKEIEGLEDKLIDLRKKLRENRMLLEVEKETKRVYQNGVIYLSREVTRLKGDV